MAISAYYALRGQHLAFARRSMTVAASFGLASALSVVILGDESGYVTTQHQHMKIATLEAMWETEAAPAGLTLFGFPDSQTKQVKYSLKAPWLLGLMATRSFTTPIPGINELVECAKTRIKSGVYAYDALQKLK
jgi:cytochrome d ubiquinol oxidase subunit I